MSIDTALLPLIAKFEQDRSLFDHRHLSRRVDALDALDAHLPHTQSLATPLHQRASAIRAKLESVNLRLCHSIRRDLQRGHGTAGGLLEWMPDCNAAAMSRSGYDHLDALLTGVLQFEEPSAQLVPLHSEMVAYQPTPARHIFDLINRTALTEYDSLLDLGSGLGHVTLLASICSAASCTGIEFQPSYVHCARKCARSLHLHTASFIQGDARAADLSHATVFYFYTPFRGAILRHVLNSLRQQALSREIRVCTFGPCTPVIAQEPWLSVVGPLETGRIAIFQSRD